MESIAMVMRRLKWLGHVEIRDETVNIRTGVDMKMGGKCPRGRSRSRWKDNVRRNMKA